MLGELPVVGGGVEDEDVVKVFALVALSAVDDEVAVKGVHGVAVARLGSHTLRLQLHPLQLAHPLQVDLPDVVEVEAKSAKTYLAVL